MARTPEEDRLKIALRCIGHVSYAVADLDRSIPFYEMLGLEQTRRFRFGGAALDKGTGLIGADMEIAFLEGPHFRLELLQDLTKDPHVAAREVAAKSREHPYTVGHGHICFEVDDLLGLHRELEARGVAFSGTPSDHPPIRFVYLRDPDGITVELLERTEEASPNIRTSS